MTSGLPFDDFRALFGDLPQADDAAGSRTGTLFGAGGDPASGRIEELAVWLSVWSGRSPPLLRGPQVAIFAGNHGVARNGVSAQSAEDTQRAVERIAAGGAAVNQACVAHDLGLKVFDLALDLPTGDIATEAALDERGCAATMAYGMEAIVGGADLLGLSSFGAGGSTAAAAVFAMLFGGDGAYWVDPLPDIDTNLTRRKAEAVDAALAVHGSHRRDPLEVLRRCGGREMAAIAGAILAARAERIPVILDGSTAVAAATIVDAAGPGAIAHCLLAQAPAQPAALRAARTIGLAPLFDLRMADDQGTGAALAAGLVRTAGAVAGGFAEANGR